MMPERIGIIGKTQGVSESSRPKPKKLAMTTQALAPESKRAMRPDSSAVGARSTGPAAGSAPASGISRLTDCFCGG